MFRLNCSSQCEAGKCDGRNVEIHTNIHACVRVNFIIGTDCQHQWQFWSREPLFDVLEYIIYLHRYIKENVELTMYIRMCVCSHRCWCYFKAYKTDKKNKTWHAIAAFSTKCCRLSAKQQQNSKEEVPATIALVTWVALWLCIATDDDDNDRRLKWNRHAMACRGPNRISAHAYIYTHIHTTYIHMYVHHTESIRHRHSHLKTERLSSRVLDGNPRAQTNIHIYMYVCTYMYLCMYICIYTWLTVAAFEIWLLFSKWFCANGLYRKEMSARKNLWMTAGNSVSSTCFHWLK